MGEYRFDDHSQRILKCLYENGAMTIPELGNQTGRDSWHATNHRLEKQLQPAGLVRRVAGEDDRKTFQISTRGEEFVREHGLEYATLADVKDNISEIRAWAQQAEEAAEGAERKVKVVVDQIEDLENELAELTEEFNYVRDRIEADHYETEFMTSVNYNRISDDRNDIHELKNQIESLKRDSETAVTEDELDSHKAWVREQLERLDNRGADRWDTSRKELDALQARIEQLENHHESDDGGFLSKIWPF